MCISPLLLGFHCERCAQGFYGNPLKLGDGECRQCDCSGNQDLSAGGGWCDARSGRCLACLGHTSGWNCNECQEGYWGDPLSGACQREYSYVVTLVHADGGESVNLYYTNISAACSCSPYGAMGGKCDVTNGQCSCRPQYTGRDCGRCVDPLGHPAAACRHCQCHSVGAATDVCDAATGQCRCKPGVTGQKCDRCLPNYFGLSSSGCQSRFTRIGS
jgi:laminin alpha 1/2